VAGAHEAHSRLQANPTWAASRQAALSFRSYDVVMKLPPRCTSKRAGRSLRDIPSLMFDGSVEFVPVGIPDYLHIFSVAPKASAPPHQFGNTVL
jgi:hypothetical protein